MTAYRTSRIKTGPEVRTLNTILENIRVHTKLRYSTACIHRLDSYISFFPNKKKQPKHKITGSASETMSKMTSSLEPFTYQEQLSRLRHFILQMTTEAYLMDPTETWEEWRRLRGALSTIYTFLKGSSGTGGAGLLSGDQTQDQTKLNEVDFEFSFFPGLFIS